MKYPILWRHGQGFPSWGNSLLSHGNAYGNLRTLIHTSVELGSGDLASCIIISKYSVTEDMLGLEHPTSDRMRHSANDFLRLSIVRRVFRAVLHKFPLTFHYAPAQYDVGMEYLEIPMGQVILRLFGPFNVRTGFGVDSFLSSSSHSFGLINHLTEAFINNSLSLSRISLCTREIFTLRSLFACSDVVLEQLSLRLQVVCSNFVHKHFYAFSFLAQDSLNSCDGRSVSSSSVALFLYARFAFLLYALSRLLRFIMTAVAAHGTGTGTGQVVPLNDVKFDISSTTPAASNTGWTRTARAALKDEGLVKFREAFTKKVLKTLISSNLNVSSYKATEMDEKSNFFNAIGQWSSASLQIQSWMRTHFVDTVFVLMKTDNVSVPDPNNANSTIVEERVVQVDSLFKIWNTVTIDEVYRSCEIYYRYADSPVEAQNLNLSWEFIMTNIDNDMRAIVNAELSSYMNTNPTVAQSGPMAFHVIANRIIRCTTGLAHNVVTGLMGMGLCHFKGENVVDCVATLRSVLLFLGHDTPRSQAPPTLNKILVDVFLRCSNPVFVSYVRNLADFHASEIDAPEKLFSKVQVYYNELLMKPNGWIRSTKNRAAFTAELPELDAVLEAQGMTRDDLSTTKIPEEVTIKETKGKGKRSKQAAQAGGGTPASDKGKSGEKDAQGRWVYDRRGNKIDYNPPRQGQSDHRARADGSTEWWCKDCGRWGNHGSSRHEDFINNRNQQRNRQGNGGGNGGTGGSDANANANAGGTSNAPPSMHRANVAQPILSILTGQGSNFAYDSDNSF